MSLTIIYISVWYNNGKWSFEADGTQQVRGVYVNDKKEVPQQSSSMVMTGNNHNNNDDDEDNGRILYNLHTYDEPLNTNNNSQDDLSAYDEPLQYDIPFEGEGDQGVNHVYASLDGSHDMSFTKGTKKGEHGTLKKGKYERLHQANTAQQSSDGRYNPVGSPGINKKGGNKNTTQAAPGSTNDDLESTRNGGNKHQKAKNHHQSVTSVYAFKTFDSADNIHHETFDI